MLATIFGGGDTDAGADLDADFDAAADADTALDAGSGWVNLLSIRTILLFAAFFGLCGVLLPLAGVTGLTRALVSLATGLGIGITGNYVISRVAYAHVSSNVTADDLKGQSAKVLLPFGQYDRGKIALVGKGQRIQMVARSFEDVEETYGLGDEVVVVRVEGGIAEVVKPS